MTEDGWDLPLRRIVPRVGASGEPVLVATELGQGGHTVDALPDRSLLRALHDAGYDVWLFHHRGDPKARPPASSGPCDADAVATLDLPAAIERVRAVTGAPRVLWLGHGFGAHVGLIHIARCGGAIAGLVSIAAPVLFPTTRTRARVVGRVAEWLPSEWRVPIGTIADILAPGPGGRLVQPLARECGGAQRRGMLLHGTEAVRWGMIQQGARWFEHGHLTDRTGTIDYTAALRASDAPMLLVTAEDDPLCPPRAVAPLLRDGVDALRLGAGWSHFDPLLAPDAPDAVFAPVLEWLADHRASCWEPAPF